MTFVNWLASDDISVLEYVALIVALAAAFYVALTIDKGDNE